MSSEGKTKIRTGLVGVGDFADAVRMHKFKDQINLASETGNTQVVNWN